MKKQITILIFGLSLLLSHGIYAQSVSNSGIAKQYFEMGEFFRWGHGSNGKTDSKKALIAYQHSAELGYPDGIMAMGEMHLLGKGGLKKNERLAFELFKKAYELGSGRACYDLGMAYFYGQGCEVDYKKMLEYMNKGIARKDHSSFFGLGVMYYKGWGVQQSYTKAIQLFEQAVPLRSASSNYYLGICYRNGYGVARDKQKGDSLLAKATRMCPFAKEELENNEAEIDRNKKITKKEYDAPEKYLKRNNSASISQFEGQWTGHITIYDWSGQYKLDQEEVVLNIVLEKDLFVGKGSINGEPVEISGFNNQYGIEFNSGGFTDNNHYFGKQKLRIETGSFETYQHGSDDVLAGNIDLYSIDKKCPERPAYLVLSKKKPKNKSAEVVETTVAVEQVQDEAKNVVVAQKNPVPIPVQNKAQGTEGVKPNQSEKQQTLLDRLVQSNIDTRVWPVPFSNTINVEYNLNDDGDVLIRLVSIDGKRVYELSNKAKHAGQQTEQFTVNATKGVYLLQVISKTQRSTNRVIKK